MGLSLINALRRYAGRPRRALFSLAAAAPMALPAGLLMVVGAVMPVQAGTVTISGNPATDTTNLNAEIAAANASGTPYTITIAASGANNTINLMASITHLTPTQTVTIVGTGGAKIDGGGNRQLFVVDTGTVAFQDLTLQNGFARGGNGGNSSAAAGGGGLGAGAGLFVNVGAAVSLENVGFASHNATGGNGGTTVANLNNGGAGGGGLNGGVGSNNAGTTGGNGGSGSGFPLSGGTGGSGGGNGGAGSTGGGGGGGGGNAAGTGGVGGNGGFGAGGGGGGGGSVAHGAGSSGGGGGGDGSSGGGLNGQAGTGYGGAVFVMDGGSLIIKQAGDFAFSGNAANKGVSGQVAKQNLGNDIFISNLGGAPNNVTLQIASGTSILSGSASSASVGSIAGEGGITKTGAGTLVLSGANTYTGGTTINAGTLQVSSNANLGDPAGGLTFNGGTLATTASFDSFRAVTLAGAGGVDVGPGTQLQLGGAISGAGSLTKLGAGTLLLSGFNTHSGGTTVAAGILQAGSADALGSGVLTLDGGTFKAGESFINSFANAIAVNATGGAIDVNGQVMTLSGNITDGIGAGGALSFVNSATDIGAVDLGGANSYGGPTSVGAGVTLTALSDTAFSPNSDVTLAATGALMVNGHATTVRSLSGSGIVVNASVTQAGSLTIALPSGTASFAGTLSDGEPGDAPLALAKAGAGTQILTGTNTFSGGTTIFAGTLIGQAASFGSGAILNNAAMIIDQPTDASFDNAVNGSGSLTKRGAGRLNLTGTGNLTGPTTVAVGTLAVNGSLANSAVTVLSGATLAGSGTVGATTIHSGATVAPGNSIGTLNVNGNLVLAPGSTYAVEIAGNGTSDRIAASGQATVTGAQLSITALDPQASYINGQRYTVITAAGGVIGTVAGAASRAAFLDVAVDHRPSQVDLIIGIKSTPSAGAGPTPAPAVFQTVAQTRNQFATAGALDTLPQVGGALALYNSLLILDAGSARQAFGGLSGEIHASAKSALIDESWLLRSTVNDRLRAAFGAVGAQPMATLSYGFTADLAPSATGPMPRLGSDRFAVWGQGYGSWGRSDADGNAAKLTRSTGGFLLGTDVAAFDTMRFGVIAGYSRSKFDVNARLSSGESDNYHLGLYGGGQWGALGLRTGASYTWHDVATRRTVAFAGFSDNPRAGYDAGTAQVFGELGYRVALGKVALEPFAGLAYVSLHTDGLRETGGAAALSGRGDDTSLGYSTLGLRASSQFALQGMDLTLRGTLAWRHAFGDVDPKATLAFAGSSPFSVAGLPIAKNAALVEAGLDLAISSSASLGLSYTGQLAADTQDHAFKANLAVRF